MTFGGGGSKAPPAPQYVPPPAAPSYVAPPDPNSVVPPAMSTKQIIQKGNYVEGFTTTDKKGKIVGQDQVPVNLRLDKDPLSHEVRAPYEDNFYQQYINPQVAQAQADASSGGQSYSSYGGAHIGQIQAQGQLAKFQAGLQAAQQVYDNTLAGRQSYFQGGPRITQEQNALDVTRGLGVAGIQSQNFGSQNNFNSDIFRSQVMASGNQNSFNQGIYGTQSENARYSQGLGVQRANGFGQALGGIIGSFIV